VAVLALARYSRVIYTPLEREITVAKTGVAKLFRNGRSQAVRLPREFRFEGDRVRVRRVSEGVLLEPLVAETAKWYEELDRWSAEPFLLSGRKQPKTPRREIFK
jgi:antitoxin VapB